jgi:polar amino acid transport system substrate-binding protein
MPFFDQGIDMVQNSSLRRSAVGTVLVIVLLLTGCGRMLRSNGSGTATKKETALQRIRREGVMRIGYAGFPPYVIVDPNNPDLNKRMSGYSVDLVNEIAKSNVPPLKIEWHNMNWDTLKADINSGKFDFVAEPVYMTIPRAIDFGFAQPYSYFGIALAVVRKNDNRFKTFQDLDRPDITIAVTEGWVSSEYAREHLKRPKFKSIPVGGDCYVQLDDVLFGRSDVALQDSPSVVQYVKAHPDKVKALWVESPPSMVAGCFAASKDETDLLSFLSACTRIMNVDGTLSKLDKKWKTYGYFDQHSFVPAIGLQQFLRHH